MDIGARGIQVLNQYFKKEFIHRVQKSMRPGSSIEREFPHARDTEEGLLEA